jgi:hypothetical protein
LNILKDQKKIQSKTKYKRDKKELAQAQQRKAKA